MITKATDSNVLLEKFELDNDEMLVAKKIIDKCVRKINRYATCEQIKLEMKVRQKGKNKHFEIKGSAIYPGGKAISEQENVNPFVAINEALSKILGEIQHSVKKKK